MDLVFLIDESGSMFDDVREIQVRLAEVATQLQAQLDVRLGLVGFGAFAGHHETTWEGEPHVHLPLMSDLQAFEDALGELVASGGTEPGFGAIALAMSEAMGFRPGAGACAVLITDEDADVTAEAPTTQAEAQAALQSRGAVLFSVIDPGYGTALADYGPKGLAGATRGRSYHVFDFRADPSPVLTAILSECAQIVTGRPPEAEEPGRAREEPTSEVAEPLEKLEAQLSRVEVRLERLTPTVATLLERIDAQGFQLSALEARLNAHDAGITSLRTTVSGWATHLRRLSGRVDALEAAVQERFAALEQTLNELKRQLETRRAEPPPTRTQIRIQQDIAVVRQTITSLNVTVAQLSEAHQQLAQQLQGQTVRVGELERQLAQDWNDRLTGFQRALNALEERLQLRLQAVQEQYDGFFTQLASLRVSVGDLSEQQEALQGQIQQWNERMKERTDAFEATLAQLSQRLDEDFTALQKALNALEARLQERLDQAEGQIVATQDELKGVQGRLADAYERLNALQSAVSNLIQTQGDLHGQLQALTERLSALEKTLEEELPKTLEARFSTLQGALDALKGPLADWERALSSVHETVLQHTQALGQLDELAGQLRQLTSSLSALQEDAFARLEALSAEVAPLQSALDEAHARIAALEEGLDALRSEAEGWVTQIDEHMEELSARLDALAADLEVLRDELARLNALEATVAQMQGRLEALAEGQQALGDRLARLETLVEANQKAIQALDERLRAEREALKEEILAQVPQLPSEIHQEHVPERPDLALRLAVVAVMLSLAAIALALLI
jgi:chromosome segregation ATPase